MKLDASVVSALLNARTSADLVLAVRENAGVAAATRVAHWLSSVLRAADSSLDTSRLDVLRLTELSAMTGDNELSSTAAKDVFMELLVSTESPRAIAEAKNLLQVSDESAIGAIVDEVLADPANAKAMADIQAGNERVVGFLVGQIMKKSSGKANPALAQKLLRERMGL